VRERERARAREGGREGGRERKREREREGGRTGGREGERARKRESARAREREVLLTIKKCLKVGKQRPVSGLSGNTASGRTDPAYDDEYSEVGHVPLDVRNG
jgi:hypothetical protein